MKKFAILAALLLAAGLVVSCGEGKADGGAAAGGVKGTAVEKVTDPKVFPLYSEAYGGGCQMDVDTKIYVWNGMKMETVFDAPAVGLESWKIKVNMGVDWFGWGVHVSPKTFWNMSGYDKGFLKFRAKVTKNSSDFKIGIKHGFSTESWMDIKDGMYGYKKDNEWHEVAVPFADFVPKINFKAVNIWWMMAQAMGVTPTGGSTYYLDEMLWTKE